MTLPPENVDSVTSSSEGLPGATPRDATPLVIRLFGELDVRLGETSLPRLESARAESLLAYLLLHREAAQPRLRLAFILWPDSTEAQAQTNLRHVLHNLRRALPEADRYLEVGQRTLRWRTDAPSGSTSPSSRTRSREPTPPTRTTFPRRCGMP